MLSSKILNKIIAIIFFIIILSTIQSFAIVSPTKEFFVNDYAGVLTEETKQYIMEANKELQQKTGAQIVIVTVNSLEGQALDEYSIELARTFRIGDANKDNGVLLLCSTGERQFRIEVGDGLEGRLTDGKTGRIQDVYIIPYLKNNNYDEGIKNGFNAILQEVCNEYGVTVSKQENPTQVQYKSNLTAEETQNITFSIALLYTLIFTWIIGISVRGRSIKLKVVVSSIYICLLILFINYASYNRIGVEEINITRRIIMFLINCVILLIYNLLKPRRKKKKRKTNSWFNDNFWGGDSFGGGSSGGGFSGGGGSFSGGGSSRSF